MILATDTQYVNHRGITAGVVFEHWAASVAAGEYVSEAIVESGYVPGQFYKRELPGILNLLREHSLTPKTIVVDGYVFLDGVVKPALGKHLYDALKGRVAVVGVAKTAFAGIGATYALFRGGSQKPLYITVIGDDLDSAKANVLSMHGNHRIPSLLKRVDRICRERAASLPM